MKTVLPVYNLKKTDLVIISPFFEILKFALLNDILIKTKTIENLRQFRKVFSIKESELKNIIYWKYYFYIGYIDMIQKKVSVIQFNKTPYIIVKNKA